MPEEYVLAMAFMVSVSSLLIVGWAFATARDNKPKSEPNFRGTPYTFPTNALILPSGGQVPKVPHDSILARHQAQQDTIIPGIMRDEETLISAHRFYSLGVREDGKEEGV